MGTTERDTRVYVWILYWSLGQRVSMVPWPHQSVSRGESAESHSTAHPAEAQPPNDKHTLLHNQPEKLADIYKNIIAYPRLPFHQNQRNEGMSVQC